MRPPLIGRQTGPLERQYSQALPPHHSLLVQTENRSSSKGNPQNRKDANTKKTMSANRLQFSGQMWVFTRLGAAAAASCVPVPQLRSPPSCQTRPNVHRSFTLSIRINNITWDRMINTLTTFPFPSKGITCYHQSYQQIRPTPQTLLILSTSFIRINKIGRINTFDLCPKIK